MSCTLLARARVIVLALCLPFPLMAQDSALAKETMPRTKTADSLAVVRVCAAGDITLGTNLDTTWTIAARRRMGRPVRALPDPAALLAPVRSLFADADVAVLNVEGAIGAERTSFRKCAPGSTMCFAFRQPVATARALRGLAPDAQVVGNVANNHAGDAGEEGRVRTAEHLRDAGVHLTGADTLATLVPLPDGDTLAVLGFSTSAGPDPRDLDAVRRHVGRAAARWRRVVVTMHLGAEGARAQRTRDSTELFLGIDRGNPVAFARAAVAAGADLVLGHGPHVQRAVEWQGDALVVYSLGNFVTYGPFSFGEPMNRGAVACATIDPQGRVLHASMRSTVQRPPGFVRIDVSDRAAVIADSLSRLDFPESGARLVPEATIYRPRGGKK